MPRRKAKNGNRFLQIIEMEQALELLKAEFYVDCERGQISPEEEHYLGLFPPDCHPKFSRNRPRRRTEQETQDGGHAAAADEPIAARTDSNKEHLHAPK